MTCLFFTIIVINIYFFTTITHKKLSIIIILFEFTMIKFNLSICSSLVGVIVVVVVQCSIVLH